MHTQENWELGHYEVIEQMWHKISNKVKGSRLEKKRKCEENNKTRRKLIYVKKAETQCRKSRQGWGQGCEQLHKNKNS